MQYKNDCHVCGKRRGGLYGCDCIYDIQLERLVRRAPTPFHDPLRSDDGAFLPAMGVTFALFMVAALVFRVIAFIL
jgi:hypothetical protein